MPSESPRRSRTATLRVTGSIPRSPTSRCRSSPTPRCPRRPRAGASYADFRFERLVTADLTIRDTAVQSATDAVSTGYAVRVIVDGTWGFAASVVPTADEAAAHRAAGGRGGRALAGVVAERVERADEPVYRDATWVSELPHRPVRRRGARTRSRCCWTGPSGCWPPTASRTPAPGCSR